MEAIRLTKINGEKFFVNINEVSHFESVKKGMVVHFESGDSIRVRETFPILDYILENCVFEIDGAE